MRNLSTYAIRKLTKGTAAVLISVLSTSPVTNVVSAASDLNSEQSTQVNQTDSSSSSDTNSDANNSTNTNSSIQVDTEIHNSNNTVQNNFQSSTVTENKSDANSNVTNNIDNTVVPDINSSDNAFNNNNVVETVSSEIKSEENSSNNTQITNFLSDINNNQNTAIDNVQSSSASDSKSDKEDENKSDKQQSSSDIKISNKNEDKISKKNEDQSDIKSDKDNDKSSEKNISDTELKSDKVTITTDEDLKKFEADFNAEKLNQSHHLGIAGAFHLFGEEVILNADTNGNIAAGNLTANVDFGTRGESNNHTKGDIYYIESADKIPENGFRNEHNYVVFGDGVNVETKDGKVLVDGKVITNLKPEQIKKIHGYLDIKSELARLAEKADNLQKAPETAGVKSDFTDMNNKFIDVSDVKPENGTIYINIDPADLLSPQPITIKGLSEAKDSPAIVLNVGSMENGKYDIQTQIKLVYADGHMPSAGSEGHAKPNKVLWNFGSETTEIKFSSGCFLGSVLAPNAEIKTDVNVNGNIIGKKIIINAGESHRWDLNHDLTDVVIPEPGDSNKPTPDPTQPIDPSDPKPEESKPIDPSPVPPIDPKPETPEPTQPVLPTQPTIPVQPITPTTPELNPDENEPPKAEDNNSYLETEEFIPPKAENTNNSDSKSDNKKGLNKEEKINLASDFKSEKDNGNKLSNNKGSIDRSQLKLNSDVKGESNNVSENRISNTNDMLPQTGEKKLSALSIVAGLVSVAFLGVCFSKKD